MWLGSRGSLPFGAWNFGWASCHNCCVPSCWAREHVFSNKGIGGTSSGVFTACAESIVPPTADLVS
jgi:hypothetical protein